MLHNFHYFDLTTNAFDVCLLKDEILFQYLYRDLLTTEFMDTKLYFAEVTLADCLPQLIARQLAALGCRLHLILLYINLSLLQHNKHKN